MSRYTNCFPGLLSRVFAILILSSCTTTVQPPPYHQEEFSENDTYTRNFASTDTATCEAGRRALLSQGYIIGRTQQNSVDGTKSFQTDTGQHIEISFHVVCAANGQSNATAFVSATQDSYALKKTNNSASLGVGVLGSVSMPFGSSDDALVKVASETIHSSQFYDRFFGALERYLAADGAIKKPSVASPTP